MVYLDNAATSFPKPESVCREMDRCMRLYCGNPGRASHRLAMQAAEAIYTCREELAALMGSRHPERVIFTLNATMALNMAIKGLLKDGDHVLISDLEHNAVRRPICELARQGKITYTVFPSLALMPNRTPHMICREIEARLRPNTKMLICTQASNICSAIMPVLQIGTLCRRWGILFVVDAAQSAGHTRIHAEDMQIDALCAPGHKGLLGAQGSGFLLLGEQISPETLIEGGSGVYSLEESMPLDPPERYEAGTLPTPAIAALCEGVRFLRQIGIDEIAKREGKLYDELLARLSAIPKITVYAPHLSGSVLLFSADGWNADALGSVLDRRGICVRTGLHCAPLAHQTLHTPPCGAVRVSPSFFNTVADLDALYFALKEELV